MRYLIGFTAIALLLSACAANTHMRASLAGPRELNRAPAVDRTLTDTLQGKVTGIVMVARGGRVIAIKSFADPAQGLIPTRHTVFDLASIGKTFTAVLALKLEQEGRFNLDEPLRAYLPELPPQMADISGRAALAHDAGLPRYLEGDDLVRRTATQALAEIASVKRDRLAGSGYYYSNLGPQLVALAIERRTGASFEGLMRDVIFKPLKMRSTYMHGDPALRRARVAPAFVDSRSSGSPADWPSTWTMLGAAGIAASVDDMGRFSRGIFNGKFLGKASRAKLLANGVSTNGKLPYRGPDTIDPHYGSGLFHFKDRQGRRIHFHGGSSDFGSSTAMLWREEDDVLVIALFNSSSKLFDRGNFLTAVLAAVDHS